MQNSFDPIQETYEEYLRRVHLDDRLNNNEWKYDKDKTIISFEKAVKAAAETKKKDYCNYAWLHCLRQLAAITRV